MRRTPLVLALLSLMVPPASAFAIKPPPPPPPPPPPTYPAAGTYSSFAWNNTPICGGNSFSTCASVAVSAVSDGAGNVTVTMRVTNLSGNNGTYAGTVFTQVGLWNVPTGGKGPSAWPNYGSSYSVVDQNNQNVSASWQPGSNGLSGAGIQPGVFGVDPTKGINGGLTPGNTYTFTFTITGWQGTSADFNNLGFAIHGQGGPNGCSTKLVIQSDGSSNTPDLSDPTVQACQPTTVTPEPVSMSLLATGLAGMGGAGLVRRRRKQADA